MKFVLSFLNINVLLLLSLLHFFWVLGGKWAFSNIIPTDLNGRRVFSPSRIGTFLIAGGLLLFALVNLCYLKVFEISFNSRYIEFSMILICSIFFFRFIGELKYVGIFKKFRQSEFAVQDTYFYSPLSLFLSISHGVLVCLVN